LRILLASICVGLVVLFARCFVLFNTPILTLGLQLENCITFCDCSSVIRWGVQLRGPILLVFHVDVSGWLPDSLRRLSLRQRLLGKVTPFHSFNALLRPIVYFFFSYVSACNLTLVIILFLFLKALVVGVIRLVFTIWCHTYPLTIIVLVLFYAIHGAIIAVNANWGRHDCLSSVLG